jgi:hypothetical protein
LNTGNGARVFEGGSDGGIGLTLRKYWVVNVENLYAICKFYWQLFDNFLKNNVVTALILEK